MQSQLQRFLLSANCEPTRTEWRHMKKRLAAKAVSKWPRPKSLLLRRIFFRVTVTSEAEISVSGKGGFLLGIGKDKKGSLLE